MNERTRRVGAGLNRLCSPTLSLYRDVDVLICTRLRAVDGLPSAITVRRPVMCHHDRDWRRLSDKSLVRPA